VFAGVPVRQQERGDAGVPAESGGQREQHNLQLVTCNLRTAGVNSPDLG
jgi:hypothetical protein